MNIKSGVDFDVHPSMWYARLVTDIVHREMTGQGGTITSALRSKSPGGSSLHVKGRAIDVRVWAFSGPDHIRQFAKALRKRLGPDFDVVVEGPAAEHPKYKDRDPHVHIEWDPK